MSNDDKNFMRFQTEQINIIQVNYFLAMTVLIFSRRLFPLKRG